MSWQQACLDCIERFIDTLEVLGSGSFPVLFLLLFKLELRAEDLVLPLDIGLLLVLLLLRLLLRVLLLLLDKHFLVGPQHQALEFEHVCFVLDAFLERLDGLLLLFALSFLLFLF